ncbi:MAG: efflux RND transporter permease subunit [Deltaproteobacteria bacterium]|nr:efflux RND transporter permease subunit [Deltaproteobacteria bacterium]
MKPLFRFFVDRHLLVNMIVISTLVVGLFVLRNTQRETFPATTLNLLFISAVYPGGSAEDIEQKLIAPIEEAVRRVDGVDLHSSVSNSNIGVVTLELMPAFNERDVIDFQSELQKELDAISDFPSDMPQRPHIRRATPANIPAVEVFFTGPSAGVHQAASQMEDVLSRLKEVSEIVPLAHTDPEIHILIDPDKSASLGITLDEIMAKIKKSNRSETGGHLESAPHMRQVIFAASLKSKEDVENVVLRFTPSGGLLVVKDVARVEFTREDKGLLLHGNGSPGASLLVKKRAKADIIRCVDAVKESVAQANLPPGVTYAFFNDSSVMARDRLNVVATNGLTGIVLVIIVLMFFLSRRIAFWVAFGIPFAVLGVGIVMPLFDLTINMVSMAAFVLVIGLIVDDAIVVAERIAYHRERGLLPRDAAVQGALEMSLPVLASSLTTIMAFSPMFAIGGLSGKFGWAIPTVVILALSVSLFECFFLLPAHVSGDHDHHDKGLADVDKKAPWMLSLERSYERGLRRLLPHRKKVTLFFVLFFIGTMALAKMFMPIELFPQDDARAFYVRVRAPAGTPLAKTEAIVSGLETQIEHIVKQDLDGYVARIGHRALRISKPRGDDESEAVITVFLRPDRIYTPLAWVERLKLSMNTPLDVEVLMEHQVIGPPLGKPVTVHISANDEKERREVMVALRNVLSNMKGVSDLDVDERGGIRQIDLQPDAIRLAALGVDSDTLARAVRGAFMGIPVTETRGAKKSTTLRVRYQAAARQNLDALLQTQVRSARGDLVPLKDVLRPVEVDSVSRIFHRDGVRTTTLTASLSLSEGLTSTSVAKKLEREVLPALQERYPSVRVAIGGEAKSSQETLGDMPLVAAMAFAGMLMIVTLLFGSFLQALFVVAAVPLGYAGVVWTFAAHGMPISFFSLLGAIGLSGIVVNDSIVMVSTLTQVQDSNKNNVVLDDVIEGAVQRLRPVLLTTVTTVVGVMPTAYGVGGRDALLSPMSVALGWGLMFATTITLLLVPALFMIRKDADNFFANAKKARQKKGDS